MKKWILLIVFSLALSSCWKMDKPTPPRLLPDRVGFTERVPVKFDTGYRKVPAYWDTTGVYIPQRYVRDSIMPVLWATVPIKEYEVVPNGDQVMRYAHLNGYGVSVGVGIILMIILIAAGVFGAGYYNKGSAKAIVYIFAIVAAIASSFFTMKPANIARNNAKTITEKQLRHYQQIDPDLNYFWDSVYKKGDALIVR